MEWEKKAEMCQLANEGKTKEFFDFVVQNMDEFKDDEQAQEMLFTAIPIDEIENNKDACAIIYEASKDWKFSSIKTAYRAVYFDKFFK